MTGWLRQPPDYQESLLSHTATRRSQAKLAEVATPDRPGRHTPGQLPSRNTGQIQIHFRVLQPNMAGHDQTIITGGDHMVVTLSAAGAGEPTAPGLLPRDVPGFAGRDEELAWLKGLAGGGRVVVAAIGGAAGVGQNALAGHAAQQFLG